MLHYSKSILSSIYGFYSLKLVKQYCIYLVLETTFIKNTVLLSMRVFVYITLMLVISNKLLCQDTYSHHSVTTGIASFYAKKFNGRRTTSGAIFYNDSLTGAHKKLKFGTYVRVRNLKNDSTVIVKITDRLPQKSKRTIDLTRRAAKQLNFIQSGLTKVEITVLDTLTH